MNDEALEDELGIEIHAEELLHLRDKDRSVEEGVERELVRQCTEFGTQIVIVQRPIGRDMQHHQIAA